MMKPGNERKCMNVKETSEAEVRDIEGPGPERQLSQNAAPAAAVASQDPLRVQDPLLIGLIAHLMDSTSHTEIAATMRRLSQLGQDILSGTPEGNTARSAAVPLGTRSGDGGHRRTR
jgi:hypothetical protein